MAAVAAPPGGAGAPGGGGGGGGLPPWRIFDGLEEVFINEEDFDEEESSESEEEEWADFQHHSKVPPGLRYCFTLSFAKVAVQILSVHYS